MPIVLYPRLLANRATHVLRRGGCAADALEAPLDAPEEARLALVGGHPASPGSIGVRAPEWAHHVLLSANLLVQTEEGAALRLVSGVDIRGDEPSPRGPARPTESYVGRFAELVGRTLRRTTTRPLASLSRIGGFVAVFDVCQETLRLMEREELASRGAR